MMVVEQITRWSALAVGAVAAIYGLARTVRAKPSGRKPRIACGFFIWPNSISAALTVLAAVVLLSRGYPGTAGALFVGWFLIFALFFISRAAGRKLATEAGSTDQVRTGYSLLSASGLLSCAAALTAVGIVLLADPRAAMTVEVLITLSLGFWLAITFWALPSSLYRGLLQQEADTEPIQVTPLCVQFRSAAGEIAFLAVAGLAAAASMARFRFPAEQIFGSLYPVGAFAASLMFGMLVVPLLSPVSARNGGSKNAIRLFAIAAFLVGTSVAAYSLAYSALGDMRAFYSYEIGLVLAVLLMLTARYRPPFTSLGSPFGVEIAVAEGLMVLAAAVLAFRFMAGYGIALCGVGLLSSLPILLPIGALWAARSLSEESGEADLPFMTLASSRFAEIIMTSGAFLIVVALLRLFSERTGLVKTGIDITDPYPLAGMIIGGSFPIVMRAISQSGKTSLKAFSFDRRVLRMLGRWAALRTLGIGLLAVITPLLVAFFWRMEAAGAFLVGLAAAELFLILTLWLGEVRNTTDEGVRLMTRSIHVLAVGSGLVTVLLVPPLVALTEAVTRTTKLEGLAVVSAALLVWMLITAYRRLKAEGV